MNRRLILTRIVQAFGATGTAALIYPFIKAWLPGEDEDKSIEINVAEFRPGETRRVNWLGRRLIIQKRTPAMLDRLTADRGSILKDPGSAESVQPRFARNEFRSLNPDVFVAFTNCTHLGCEVMTDGDRGFRCPCHDSEYDAAGRVRDGSAAPINLEVPFYRFVSRNTLRLEREHQEEA